MICFGYIICLFILFSGIEYTVGDSHPSSPLPKKIILKIGVLTPMSNSIEEMIYDRFISYGRFTTSSRYELSVTSKKTTCREIELSEVTSKLIHFNKVSMVFGPSCSGDPCRRVLESASYNGKPIITYRCDDTYFEGKTFY